MGFSGMGGAVWRECLANLGTGWLVLALLLRACLHSDAGLMHPLSAALVYWLLPNRYFFKRS